MKKYDIGGVQTFEYTKIVGLEHIEFGTNIIIDDFVFIYATNTIQLGSYIHIASFTSISGGGTLVMEDFSTLSSGVRVFTGSDDFKYHGFGNSTIGETFRNVRRGHIHIGKFVIVGANSVILPDVQIGEGVSVGAGSVVTRDLAPWGIYINNKRVGDRDKSGVLENYQKFQLTIDN
ncbi:MAG: acyltransferase [Chloroflexota bacterium]